MTARWDVATREWTLEPRQAPEVEFAWFLRELSGVLFDYRNSPDLDRPAYIAMAADAVSRLSMVRRRLAFMGPYLESFIDGFLEGLNEAVWAEHDRVWAITRPRGRPRRVH